MTSDTRFMWLCIAVVLCMMGCHGESDGESQPQNSQKPAAAGSQVKPSLAKAKLTEATTAAKQWKSDAFLIQVSSGNIGEDGLALLWNYGFYSPSAKNCLMVNVGRTTTTHVDRVGAICESPELKEFIDSDQAMAIARKNGITSPKATMVVNVEGKRTVWMVMDERGMKPGNVMLTIDAQTGAVLDKTKQG